MAEVETDQQTVVDFSKSRVERCEKIKNNFHAVKKYCFRLHSALADATTGRMSCNAAAKKWKVQRTTLRSLVKDPKHPLHRPTVTLTNAEEKKMLYWITQCSLRGCPRTRIDIKEGALRLIKLRKGADAMEQSDPWLAGFLKRHKLDQRIAQRLTTAGACITKSNVIAWFKKIQDLILTEGLEHLHTDASRIYNADESFFLLSPERGKVIVKRGMKNVFEAVKDEKSGLTVMLLI